MTHRGSVIQKSIPKFCLQLCEIYEVIMLYERAFVVAYVRETQISLIFNFSLLFSKIFSVIFIPFACSQMLLY